MSHHDSLRGSNDQEKHVELSSMLSARLFMVSQVQ